MQHLPGHTPTPRATTSPTLGQWENLARRGSQAMQTGHAGLALLSFQHALSIAQSLLHSAQANDQAHQADDCVAALVVSHHNLADLFTHNRQPEQAAIHVCCAHRTLLGLLRGQLPDRHDLLQPPSLALQQAAWRHSRETYAGLLQYQRDWGPCPAITQLLQASTHPTDSNPPTLH
ncbi:hypothetical protein [Rhodoferax sp.]|uniref:hypothetical protein n=1 Tax=Rhodoferax sp. TaxID=50421 RepID=UPI00374CBCD7